MGAGTDDAGLTLLADPTRARIVRMMRDSADGRVLVGRVAESLGLRQPTVSHHMSALHAEGIVQREKDGRRVWYSLDPAHEERVTTLLGPPPTGGEADLSRVIDDLTARYRGVFSPETVARYVTDSHQMLIAAGRPALEVSRTASFAASRLDDLTRIDGHPPDRPSVLFVCVQNAGRSQIAAGILRQLAGDRVIVRSAGSAPAADVRSSIVYALDEIGVPIGGEFPKPLSDEAVRAADWVITMGCGDACPVYPGRRYLDWDLEDPVGKPTATVRRIRDDIESRVRDLLPELVTSTV
ncbi:ArsR family transcriptional regulator [Microbacterium sp. AK009]|uniref:metalloregulator ArsR/SmtB family transcription factor n=1 Tax=Microbacterium sp. AK009 TaxID=2723068 RepID=UPI0015CE96F0|nr:metalloregulator ArsR/SmtB family transcription factor [Microbacterium sp. AK009]NYF16680.1 ArsR family transcriptional regulator [Microbacterium sp. AK009]